MLQPDLKVLAILSIPFNASAIQGYYPVITSALWAFSP
jgi:hypothetical protein